MNRFVWVPFLCLVVLAATLVVTPWIGSSHVTAARVFAGVSPDVEIFYQFRVPRVLLAALAGGALALAGTLFQALLRDSLADPFTLGISSGASLGAVLAICFGTRDGGTGLPVVWLAALSGAALAFLLVLGLASQGPRVSSFSLLMAGVTVNTMAIAVILLLKTTASNAQSFAINRWLMGSIDSHEPPAIATLGVVVLAAAGYAWKNARAWNLVAAGEEWAASRGVDTSRFLWRGFILGSAVAGSVAALTGPVGFLGLIVPHALRLMVGADHRLLIPCSLLLGGAFLAVCDTAARTVAAPNDIPVGVVTAMLGGPFFLWLLKGRQQRFWS
ncbi:MAG: iron ABC transporter permease [Acidobacteria bacterium]|nr:iron ABC transporter permease [Acidobacteriota bacterium]